MDRAIKILIIEDDRNIRELISMYMLKMDITPLLAADGEEGVDMYFQYFPDCVILDIMLPKIDGWEVCKTIRADNQTIPILMLTGKGESYDIIKGLDIGADDYIVKPFDPNELSARVRAVLRRSKLLDDQQDMMTLANITVNMKEFRVLVGGEEIKMAPKEIELLAYFVTNPNQVLSRQQLLDRIWGYDFDGDPRTIDVHIKRLRDKLAHHEGEWSITTIRGVGYRFEENKNE